MVRPRLQNLQLAHRVYAKAVRVAKKRAAHEATRLDVVPANRADRAVVLNGVAWAYLADVHFLDVEVHLVLLENHSPARKALVLPLLRMAPFDRFFPACQRVKRWAFLQIVQPWCNLRLASR